LKVVSKIGWSSGYEIYEGVAKAMDLTFADKYESGQVIVLIRLIKLLEEGDCDTLDECTGISEVSDRALKAAGYHVCENPEEDTDTWRCKTCGFNY